MIERFKEDDPLGMEKVRTADYSNKEKKRKKCYGNTMSVQHEE